MYSFITAVHIVVGIILIIAIVFLQTSNGSALSMFGGGGDALFKTASGTSFIKKVTVGCATVFAVTAITLTVMGSNTKFRSVVQDYPMQASPAAAKQKAPAEQQEQKAAAASESPEQTGAAAGTPANK